MQLGTRTACAVDGAVTAGFRAPEWSGGGRSAARPRDVSKSSRRITLPLRRGRGDAARDVTRASSDRNVGVFADRRAELGRTREYLRVSAALRPSQVGTGTARRRPPCAAPQRRAPDAVDDRQYRCGLIAGDGDSLRFDSRSRSTRRW
jgi:hypothetical protein